MLSYNAFASLVADLRTAQKAYFKERSRTNLVNAVRAEDAVDNALAEILEATQGTLQLNDPRDPMDDPTPDRQGPTEAAADSPPPEA